MYALEDTNEDGNEDGFVDTNRVTETVWILTPHAVLAGETIDALEAAFREALARGARDVVVDVGRDCPIDHVGAHAIVAMAEEMLESSSSLWLASTWPDGRGHTLRPLREVGLGHLRGVSSALDEALDTLEGRHSERAGRSVH